MNCFLCKKTVILLDNPVKRLFVLLIIIFFIFSFLTCGKEADIEEYYTDGNERDRREASSDFRGVETAGEYDDSGNEWSRTDFLYEDGKDTTKETGNNKQDEPDERMKVYFGYLHLRVDSIKETRYTVTSIADEAGGYVESLYEQTIIIRVPKESFTRILTRLMDIGEVLHKSIETYDVSDMFQDLAARLEISKKTRDRLYALLAKTKDVKERLKILKEIRRLSEEIEKISTTLENIKRLVSFSRITIRLEQRLTDLSYEDKQTIPFPWIASLDPFYVSLPRLDGKADIKTGDEFAVFDNRKYFFAESSEGVRIHIASVKNRPEGNADFWQKAVEYHLARFYKNTQPLDLGNFKAIEFTSKDTDPFFYLVGMLVKEKKIFVCEVLFPNQDAYKKRESLVKEYITNCKIK